MIRQVRLCPVCNRAAQALETRCPDDGALLVSLETGAVPAADLSGQVIDGRYRISGVLGRGGMGTVYACEHVVVGKRFAMKVLLPGVERTEDVLARFVREAKAANAIQSPHIVESVDFGQLPSGHFYVVMERLDGRSLAAAMKQRALTRAELLDVFVQTCETLELAHRANIIHRDLKPDNVFLVRGPNAPPESPPLYVKLLDFGVAKVLGSSDAALTQSGVILGTPYYMSPEQARGQGLDARADLYSLGVVMYHAFTGRLPFVADSAVGVLTAHAIDPPPRPSAVSQVDPALEAVILKCLEKRPDDRFQSMQELAGVLRGILSGAAAVSGMNRPVTPHPDPIQGLDGTSVGSGGFGRVSSSPTRAPGFGMDTNASASLAGPLRRSIEPDPPRANRSLAVAIGAGVGMLALGGVVAFAVTRGPSAPPQPATPATDAPISVPLPSSLAQEARPTRTDPVEEPSAAPEPLPTAEVADATPGASATADVAAPSRPTPRPSAAGAKPTSKPTAEPVATTAPTAAPTSRPTSGVSPEIRNPFGEKR